MPDPAQGSGRTSRAKDLKIYHAQTKLQILWPKPTPLTVFAQFSYFPHLLSTKWSHCPSSAEARTLKLSVLPASLTYCLAQPSLVCVAPNLFPEEIQNLTPSLHLHCLCSAVSRIIVHLDHSRGLLTGLPLPLSTLHSHAAARGILLKYKSDTVATQLITVQWFPSCSG